VPHTRAGEGLDGVAPHRSEAHHRHVALAQALQACLADHPLDALEALIGHSRPPNSREAFSHT